MDDQLEENTKIVPDNSHQWMWQYWYQIPAKG